MVGLYNMGVNAEKLFFVEAMRSPAKCPALAVTPKKISLDCLCFVSPVRHF